MFMLGISIHPSGMEARSACHIASQQEVRKSGRWDLCLDQGAQIILLDGDTNKVAKRFFYL